MRSTFNNTVLHTWQTAAEVFGDCPDVLKAIQITDDDSVTSWVGIHPAQSTCKYGFTLIDQAGTLSPRDSPDPSRYGNQDVRFDFATPIFYPCFDSLSATFLSIFAYHTMGDPSNIIPVVISSSIYPRICQEFYDLLSGDDTTKAQPVLNLLGL
jgi:hypothetical protein